MAYKIDEQLLRRLIGRFGVEWLIAGLPQDKVRKALELVSMQEIAETLDMNYNTPGAMLSPSAPPRA